MSSAAAPERPSGSDPGIASARVADLFERHGRMVYGVCRAMLRDVEEAEDATQQAFLSAHRALLSGAEVRDPGAWMATIARNECRARISSGMRAPLPVPAEALEEVAEGVDAAERSLRAGELRDALAGLPERQREAVLLRYVFGLRYGEVAKALGLSLPATEALLFRARRAMRVRLRHAAVAAIAVPMSVRDELALALPGFESRTGTGAAAAGAASGVLAKLVSGPVAAKVATATVVVSTVGAVGAVESERASLPGSAEVGVARRAPASAAVPVPIAAARSERSSGEASERSGRSPSSARSGRSDDDGTQAQHAHDPRSQEVESEPSETRGRDTSGGSGGSGEGATGDGERELDPTSDSPSESTEDEADRSGPSSIPEAARTFDDDREVVDVVDGSGEGSDGSSGSGDDASGGSASSSPGSGDDSVDEHT